MKVFHFFSAVTIDNSEEEDVDDILADQLKDDALKKRGKLQKTVAAKVGTCILKIFVANVFRFNFQLFTVSPAIFNCHNQRP